MVCIDRALLVGAVDVGFCTTEFGDERKRGEVRRRLTDALVTILREDEDEDEDEDDSP